MFATLLSTVCVFSFEISIDADAGDVVALNAEADGAEAAEIEAAAADAADVNGAVVSSEFAFSVKTNDPRSAILRGAV